MPGAAERFLVKNCRVKDKSRKRGVTVRRNRALTLAEVVLLIVILAVLVAILVPVLMSSLWVSETTVCQNKLNVIGRKYNDYANEAQNYANPFPRHIDDGDAHDTTSATGLKTGNTLDAIGVCGMQTVWVMLDRGDLTHAAFKCPGDEGWTRRTSTDKYGWSALTEFSYGVHYPYASDGAGTKNPAGLNAREATVAQRLVYREKMVLFADRNPGGAVNGTTRFHSNHPGSDGWCVVVNRVGNTEFLQQPDKSITSYGDDIYTDEANTASPVPDSKTDTVITPQISR